MEVNLDVMPFRMVRSPMFSAREADNFDTCFRTYRTHRDNGDTARYEYLPEDRDQAPSDGAVSLAKTDSVGGLSPKETE